MIILPTQGRKEKRHLSNDLRNNQFFASACFHCTWACPRPIPYLILVKSAKRILIRVRLTLGTPFTVIVMMTRCRLLLLLLGLALAVTPARAQQVFTHDQISFINLSLDQSTPTNPEFIVNFHNASLDQTIDPVFISGINRWVFAHNSGAVIHLQNPHLYVRPASGAWNFIGVGPLELFRATPQNGNPATHLILSVSSLEFPVGVFVNNQINITLSLDGITNPGHFSMYTNDDPFNDATGELDTIYLSTLNNFFTFSRFAGTENNFNLAFSAPGTYQLDFQFTGTLVPALGGGSVVSDFYRYTFTVAPIPEPATWGLIGLTAAVVTAGVVHYRRRKRKLLEADLNN
jgi:surface-anchored protein